MAEDGKIYITISNKAGVGSGKDDITTDKTKDEKSTTADYIAHRFYNFIQSEAKNFAYYTLGNVGNFTGDYQQQREINTALRMVGAVENIAFATKTGGIAGFIISTATQAINYGLQERSNTLNNFKQNYQISKLREISGLDETTNGGRI